MNNLKNELARKYEEKGEIKEKNDHIPFVSLILIPFITGLAGLAIAGVSTLIFPILLKASFNPFLYGVIAMIISPVIASVYLNNKHYGKINKEIKKLEKQLKKENNLEVASQLKKENNLEVASQLKKENNLEVVSQAFSSFRTTKERDASKKEKQIRKTTGKTIDNYKSNENETDKERTL